MLMFVLDVAPNPVRVVSWGPLLLILVIVFVLAVCFTFGLVVLLIRTKRRKAGSTQQSKPSPGIHHFTNPERSKVGNYDD